ncbi:MAG: ATP-binding protein [Streptosporangiaceae bacterium]|jgi:signal transduction histidine kinase
MGISSSAGTQQPDRARRTIRFTFATTVAIPATCMILLWALAAAAVLGSSLHGHRFWSPDHREVVELTILIGAGLLIALICVILMGRFSTRLSRDIAGLAATTRRTADEQLPQLLERLRSGDTGTPSSGPGIPQSLPKPKSAEIAQALAAVASLEQTAVGAAAGEAGLRNGLRQVFVSLARRNQSLLQRQLRLIDALEQKASDSAALADLFALDHLTTRMRRHAESLAILSGAAPGRSWTEPVPVIDVIRAAMAEVEDYRRVTVLTASEDAVAAPAVADMIHLLAELVENATMFSPSGTRVEVRAERVANGFAVEIDDRGLGIEPAQLAEINQQLAQPPDFDLANADRLGLFVGAKLASRHGVRVSLRQSPYGGTTAIVLMPNSIVVLVSASALPDIRTLPAARRVTGRPAPLDLGPGGAGAAHPAATARPASIAGPGNSTQPGSHVPPARAVPPGSNGAAGSTVPPRSTVPPGSNGLAAGNGAAVPGRGLPRRTRQASLSPHLRDGLAADRPGRGAAAPSDGRTPEQARDLAASLQTGWRRGRQDDPPRPPDAAAPPLPRRTGSPAPDSEET